MDGTAPANRNSGLNGDPKGYVDVFAGRRRFLNHDDLHLMGYPDRLSGGGKGSCDLPKALRPEAILLTHLTVQIGRSLACVLRRRWFRSMDL